MSPNSHYSRGDPELDPLVAALAISEEDKELTISWKRKSDSVGTPGPYAADVQVKDVEAPVNGTQILIRVYIPKNGTVEEAPLFMWYHGGGFAMGHPNMDDYWCSERASKHNMVVMSVNYRLAPENPFPIGLNDCYETLKLAASHSSKFGVDLRKGLVVAGASAGGNLAAVLAIMARDDPEFQWKITGQLLQCPILCAPEVYPKEYAEELQSYYENADVPVLSRKIADLLMSNYGVTDPSDYRVSPLIATNHRNLPRTVLQVGGADILRDETILYSKILKNHGVDTKLHVYPSGIHGFQQRFPETKAAKQWDVDCDEGIRWLLKPPTIYKLKLTSYKLTSGPGC